MLKGNQKKLDKNKDGKISGEDFKLMKKPEKANLGMLMIKKAKDKGAKGIEFLSPIAMLNKASKNKGGEMKSSKGYGAARTSGMGLQDEQLVPGKSLDYYKDIM